MIPYLGHRAIGDYNGPIAVYSYLDANFTIYVASFIDNGDIKLKNPKRGKISLNFQD